MDQPVRIALIGAGIFATKTHLPNLLNQKKCSLVAIYSRSESSVQAMAERIKEERGLEPKVCFGEEGMKAILSDESIEALDLVLPPKAQIEWVKAALPLGKHCLMEKPVANSPAEADDLVGKYTNGSLQGKRDVFLGVAENYRFEKSFRQAADLINSGQLGRIITFELVAHLHIAEDNPYTHTQWRRDPLHVGGWLLDGGVHFIAALRLVMNNSPVKQVVGFGSTLAPHLYDDEKKSTPDSVFGVVSFENNATGTVSITPAASDMRFELRVTGSQASVCVRRCNGGYEVVTTKSGAEPEVHQLPYNGCQSEVEAFLDVIKGIASDKDRELLSPSLARDDVHLVCSLLGL